MGNPLSPVLANIYMCKLEADVVKPANPPLYHRYVDDCLSKRKTDSPDHLLQSLNSYHTNIHFTVEENPDHFLDTAINNTSGTFTKSVQKKPGKLPVHWKSNTPTNWKRNSILSALHRAKQISLNFPEEVKLIKKTFLNAGYPYTFVNNTIRNFEVPIQQVETLLPTHWFDDRKEVHINLPFCNANYKQSRKFQRSLQSFTRGQCKFKILWKTKKVKSLFKNKDKINHPSQVIYHGTCSCQVNYVGETSRNLQERISEHEDITKLSEPARHLRSNPNHSFTWKVIAPAHSWTLRRILEALLIAKLRPDLNKQVQAFSLSLFPSGIT